jgi:hypothetical protein
MTRPFAKTQRADRPEGLGRMGVARVRIGGRG